MGIGARPEGADAGDTPGPGQYLVSRLASDPVVDKPQQSKPNVTRSSFRSTTSRCNPQNPREPTFVPGSGWFIASTILDNPGPGPDITRPIDFRPFTGGTYARSRPGKLDWGAERAIQAVKEGVRLQTETAPAIKPLRARGEWNFTGEPGDTPDPGEYSPDYLNIGRGKPVANFDAACERNGSWGNVAMAKNPGPGAYDHEPPEGAGHGKGIEPPGFGLPVVFFSSSWSPALLPGPGTYDPVKASPSKQPLSGFKSATARRLAQDNMRSPGPGTYPSHSEFPVEKCRRARSVPDFFSRKYFGVQNPHQLRSLRETDGSRLAGFDCSGPQRPPLVSNSLAAPGTYNPDDCLGQSISAKLRHCAKIAQGGAFGSTKTGERFPPSSLAPGDESVSPGPALPHQDAMKDAGDAAGGSFKSEAQIAKTDHVGFGSSDERFGDACTDAPPPGAYELDTDANKGCYAFKATASRGLPMPKVAQRGLDPGDLPAELRATTVESPHLSRLVG
ncbi:Hypothetical protein SCF082_LOCUS40894 [Durusdinium trenchii]|uniref:Uncharacterized protein n=1 Tax=Durusdinium trenchii TaxID=1381693 RepID=A0ABP0QEK9_9DINO